jgi:hypothetical protein
MRIWLTPAIITNAGIRWPLPGAGGIINGTTGTGRQKTGEQP